MLQKPKIQEFKSMQLDYYGKRKAEHERIIREKETKSALTEIRDTAQASATIEGGGVLEGSVNQVNLIAKVDQGHIRPQSLLQGDLNGYADNLGGSLHVKRNFSEHLNVSNSKQPITNLNLQSTLNRPSIEDTGPMSAAHHVTGSAVDSALDSRQFNHPNASSRQNVPNGLETDQFLVPTRLEVELGKRRGKSGGKYGHAKTRVKVKQYSSRTNLYKSQVKTDGISCSSNTGLMSVHGVSTYPPELLQVEMVARAGVPFGSPEGEHMGIVGNAPWLLRGAEEPAMSQDKIISDITRKFDQFNSLFTGSQNPSRGATGRLQSAIAGQRGHQNALPKQRNIGALIAQNRISASLTKQEVLPAHSKTQNTTLRGQAGRSQSVNRIQVRSRKHGKANGARSGILTSNVPTQRLSAPGSQSFPARQFKSTATTKPSSSAGLQRRGYKNEERSNSLKSREKLQQQQVSVLQLDSQQLLNLSKSSYSRKTSHGQRKVNKYVSQGPIKRLKSAMIRSVFDKGIDHDGSAVDPNFSSKDIKAHQRPSRGSSPYRTGSKLGQPDSHSESHLISNKGQQVAFPTDALTTPALLNEQGSEYHYLQAAYPPGQLLQNFQSKSGNILHSQMTTMLHHDSSDLVRINQLKNLGQQETADMGASRQQDKALVNKMRSIETTSSNGVKGGESYQRMILTQNPMVNADEYGGGSIEGMDLGYNNSTIVSPGAAGHGGNIANERFAIQDDGNYAPQPETGGNDQVLTQEGGQSLGTDLRTGVSRRIVTAESAYNDTVRVEVVGDNYTQETFMPDAAVGPRFTDSNETFNRPMRSSGPSERANFMNLRNSTEHGTEPAIKFTGEQTGESQTSSPEQIRQPASSVVYHRVPNQSNGKSIDAHRKDYQAQQRLEGVPEFQPNAIGNHTVPLTPFQAVSVRQLIEHQTNFLNDEPFNKTDVMTRDKVYLDQKSDENSIDDLDAKQQTVDCEATGLVGLIEQSRKHVMTSAEDAQIVIAGKKQPIDLSSTPLDSDNQLRRFGAGLASSGEHSSSEILSDGVLPRPKADSNLLSSGALSQPQMISKLNSDNVGGNNTITVSQAADLKEIEEAAALSQGALFLDEDLHVVNASERQLQLLVAQRDFQILTMLKEQIDEDQMQMFDLTQGLTSGMIKIDPHYMNKAIIEKIRLQTARWNQSALSNQIISQTKPLSTQAAKIQAARQQALSYALQRARLQGKSDLSEFADGLHEMQELENNLQGSSALSIIAQPKLNQTFNHSSQGAFQKNHSFDSAQVKGSAIVVTMNKESSGSLPREIQTNQTITPNAFVVQSRNPVVGSRPGSNMAVNSQLVTRISEETQSKLRQQQQVELQANMSTRLIEGTPENDRMTSDKDNLAYFILQDNAQEGTEVAIRTRPNHLHESTTEEKSATGDLKKKLFVLQDAENTDSVSQGPRGVSFVGQEEDAQRSLNENTTTAHRRVDQTEDSDSNLAMTGPLTKRLVTNQTCVESQRQNALGSNITEPVIVSSTPTNHDLAVGGKLSKSGRNPEGVTFATTDAHGMSSQGGSKGTKLQHHKLEVELKRLQESSGNFKAGTGVLSQSWLDHHINVMKPVKKFVCLNDQTQFAKIQPSILQKREHGNQSAGLAQALRGDLTIGGSQPEVGGYRNNYLYYGDHRGQSACQVPSPSTLQSLQSSYMRQQTQHEGQPIRQLSKGRSGLKPPLSALRGGRINVRPPQNMMLIKQGDASGLASRRASEEAFKTAVRPSAMISADGDESGITEASGVDEGAEGMKLEQIVARKNVPLDCSYELSRVEQSNEQAPSVNDHEARSSYSNLRANLKSSQTVQGHPHMVPRPLTGELSNSKASMRGVSGQLTQFAQIDIEALAKDKALNRHISGQQSLAYDKIKQQAQASAKNSSVARERHKTMISQQVANQRSLRNVRSNTQVSADTSKNSTCRGRGALSGQYKTKAMQETLLRSFDIVPQVKADTGNLLRMGQSGANMRQRVSARDIQRTHQTSASPLHQAMTKVTIHEYPSINHEAALGAATHGLTESRQNLKTHSQKHLR